VDILSRQGANVRLFLYEGKHKIGLSYLNEMIAVINRGQLTI